MRCVDVPKRSGHAVKKRYGTDVCLFTSDFKRRMERAKLLFMGRADSAQAFCAIAVSKMLLAAPILIWSEYVKPPRMGTAELHYANKNNFCSKLRK